jgi:hypothetical protein
MKPDGSQSDISWIDPAAYNWWWELIYRLWRIWLIMAFEKTTRQPWKYNLVIHTCSVWEDDHPRVQILYSDKER